MDLIAQIIGYAAMATVCLSFQVKNPCGTISSVIISKAE